MYIPYIESCLEYSESSYLCEKCDDNYVLYGNSHICLKKIPNCQSHYIENDKIF